MSILATCDKALLLLAVVQGLFLAVLLWLRVPQRDGRILAALLLTFTLNSALDLIENCGFGPPWLVPVSITVILIIGPLAATYFEAVAQPGAARLSPFLRRHWAFAAIAGLGLIVSLVPWHGIWQDAAAGKIGIGAIIAGILTLLMAIAAIIQQGLCLRWARRQLAAAKIGLAEGSPRDARLAWLDLLVRVLMVLWIVFVITIAGAFVSLWGEIVGDIATLLYTAAIYGLGGFALLNPEAFKPPRQTMEAVTDRLAKYRKSALTAADVERLLAKLEQEMRRTQAWRDGSLSLVMLARRIGASENDVSQAINQGTNAGFYDYVNRYRIEDAKILLLDPAQAGSTVLDIAYQVGFNSKSAFNTAFRKQTDMTPSSFRSGKTSSPIGSNDEDRLQLPG